MLPSYEQSPEKFCSPLDFSFLQQSANHECDNCTLYRKIIEQLEDKIKLLNNLNDMFNDKQHLRKIKKYVDLQANDKSIWFSTPLTSHENFLLNQLRDLHNVIACSEPAYLDKKINSYF